MGKSRRISAEEGVAFLRQNGIDVDILNLVYLSKNSEEGPESAEARYHNIWFEELQATPIIGSEGNFKIKITGTYVTQTRIGEKSNGIWEPGIPSYFPIDLETSVEAFETH
jgi:hypothetical protein